MSDQPTAPVTPDPAIYTKWVKADEGLPVNTIMLYYCGNWLSSPQVLKNRIAADKYRTENGVTLYLVIPNAKLCLP